MKKPTCKAENSIPVVETPAIVLIDKIAYVNLSQETISFESQDWNTKKDLPPFPYPVSELSEDWKWTIKKLLKGNSVLALVCLNPPSPGKAFHMQILQF